MTNYTLAHTVYAHPKLGHFGKAVGVYLLIMRRNAETGQCNPSHKTIAADCGISDRQVRRAIAELVASGVLEQRRTGGSNFYDFAPLIGLTVQSDRTDSPIRSAPQSYKQIPEQISEHALSEQRARESKKPPHRKGRRPDGQQRNIDWLRKEMGEPQ